MSAKPMPEAWTALARWFVVCGLALGIGIGVSPALASRGLARSTPARLTDREFWQLSTRCVGAERLFPI